MNASPEIRRELRRTRITEGKCGDCGRLREPVSVGGATRTLCDACAKKNRIRLKRHRGNCVARGKCIDCGKPFTTGLRGATTRYCRPCAIKHRLQGARSRRAERLARTDRFGPVPTGDPGFIGAAAKRLGPQKGVRFEINEETLTAINELKRRYREANPGKTCVYHVSEILRRAVASVVNNGGPVCHRPNRICTPGWYCSLSLPIALYDQVTRLANERFGGSRAKTVRYALQQSVDPPARVTTGGRRVLGGTLRYEWDV